jgi:hypothetical protein
MVQEFSYKGHNMYVPFSVLTDYHLKNPKNKHNPFHGLLH